MNFISKKANAPSAAGPSPASGESNVGQALSLRRPLRPPGATMRKLLFLSCCIAWVSVPARTTIHTQTVRPAAVAGSFYPADPKELAQMVDGFVAKATPPPVP